MTYKVYKVDYKVVDAARLKSPDEVYKEV